MAPEITININVHPGANGVEVKSPVHTEATILESSPAEKMDTMGLPPLPDDYEDANSMALPPPAVESSTSAEGMEDMSFPAETETTSVTPEDSLGFPPTDLLDMMEAEVDLEAMLPPDAPADMEEINGAQMVPPSPPNDYHNGNGGKKDDSPPPS